MPYGLTEETLAAIKAVFAADRRIEEVVLFGSRAKGTHKPGSDIDLAIKGSGLTLNSQLDLMNRLDDLDTPYRFDVVNYVRIEDAEVRSHIDRVGVVVHRAVTVPVNGDLGTFKGDWV